MPWSLVCIGTINKAFNSEVMEMRYLFETEELNDMFIIVNSIIERANSDHDYELAILAGQLLRVLEKPTRDDATTARHRGGCAAGWD